MKVSSRNDGSDLIIEIRFDEHEQTCLNHDLLDIVDWYSKGASLEKIYNCRQRMIKENKDLVLSSPELQNMTVSEVNKIINDPVKMVEFISKHPSYKNRKQREPLQNL